MKGGRLYYDMPIGILCLESLFPNRADTCAIH